jgi:hypothetical protein
MRTTSSSGNSLWSAAFAVQACSDFDARDQLLCSSQLPQCHQLHYLQMAMEKTAKEHLVEGGSDPIVVQASHAYIAKVIPIIVREALARVPGGLSQWIVGAVRSLARRIGLCIHKSITPEQCHRTVNIHGSTRPDSSSRQRSMISNSTCMPRRLR